MKSFLLALLVLFTFAGYSQTITPVLYPLYMQGHGTSTASDEKRVPYACRMTVSGLSPNTTYLFFNRWATDPGVPVEQGGIIFVEQAGTFRRSTAPSLGSAANSGTLITDATGSYTGWFASESNIATDFTPGAKLFFRLVLDLPGGTNPIRVTATQSVTVLAWDDYFLPPPDGPTAVGTGVRSANANTAWLPKNFIMLYDNEGGTGRPIAGTYVESDGVANTAANGYIAWYGTNINGTTAAPFNNRWGTIVPDDLPNGIRRIAQHGLSNGSLVNFCSDPDGDWGGTNGNTVNPTGGGANDATAVRIVDCTPTGGGPICSIALTFTKTDVNCFGGTTGAIDVTVTGASGAVTYSWGAGAPTTQDRTGLAAGTYTVIATDAANCTATQTITIAQPASALSATGTSTPVTTAGGSNGSTTVTVTGGTSPYTYSWNPGGQTTAAVSGRTAGSYTVTVTDAKGCTTTATTTVTGPTCTLALSSTKTDVNCFGGTTGAIDVTVTGASGAVTYSWGTGAPTTQDRTGLAAGSYTVTATDAAACTATLTVTIAQPAAALSVTATSTPVTTTGGSNGSTSVTATGGTSPYTYSWNPGGQTTATVSGRTAGSYTVTVTDAKGCTATATTTVGSPSCTIALTSTKTDVNCFSGATGAIDVTVTGASGAVTYSWGTGAPATQDRTGLAAGSYTVTATDAAACTATLTVTIAQPAAALSATATSTPVTTTGGSNGSTSVTATGGTSPYTYSWNPGGQTTATVSGRTAGSYTATVTDAKGCTATATTTVGSPSCTIALTSTKTDVNCFGGTTGAIDVTVTGASGAVTYSWGTGAPTTQDRTGLAAGSYTVTATDAAGCTATLTVNIAQPASAVTVTATSTPVSGGGANGTATASATGGTSPYTYSWNPGGQTTVTATNLAAGSYTVTVTDSKGCTGTATTTVGSPSCTIALTSTKTDVNCFGGTTGAIDVTVTGASGAVTYSWGTGAPATQDRTGLAAGSYTVTATDAAGCTATLTITIAQPASALAVTAVSTPVTTTGGSNGTATATATGGTSPYTYSWSPGGQTTATASNLTAGNYTVSVTDAKGCTATATTTVGSQQTNCTLALTFNKTDVNCFGGTTAAIDVTATGASGAVTYSWGTGVPTTQDRTGLAAGSYSVTATDAAGCTATLTITIAQPVSALAVTAVSTPVTTTGGSNGTATATATGGTSPYTYAWSPGVQTTATASNLTAGNYTVTVTDAKGCIATATVVVGTASQGGCNITLTTKVTNVKCKGDKTGKIDLTVTGASAPVTYKWDNGAAKEDIYELKAGVYNVIVTDAKQCTANATVTVTEPDELLVSVKYDIIQCNQAITTAVVTATGGIAPYKGTGSYVKGPGSYRITVEDANGCSKTVSFTVAPPLPCQTNCTDISKISNDFIRKSVTGGKYIWFNSVIDLDEKCGKEPVVVNVTNATIKFKVDNVWVVLNVPDSKITFAENIYTASTEYINGIWETKAPLSSRDRDVFMAGLAYKVPEKGLPAGLDVEWKADIKINREGSKIEWRWAAAAYSDFTTDYSKIGIKPIDEKYRYYFQEKAGTPTKFKSSLIPGGTGWGWFNYTGDYSKKDWFRCGVCSCNDNDGERALPGVITKTPNATTAYKLEVIALPNPSSSNFTLNIKSADVTKPIVVKVSDVNGKLLEIHQKVTGNILKIGKENWVSGTYYAEIIQDNQRKVVKLIKSN